LDWGSRHQSELSNAGEESQNDAKQAAEAVLKQVEARVQRDSGSEVHSDRKAVDEVLAPTTNPPSIGIEDPSQDNAGEKQFVAQIEAAIGMDLERTPDGRYNRVDGEVDPKHAAAVAAFDHAAQNHVDFKIGDSSKTGEVDNFIGRTVYPGNIALLPTDGESVGKNYVTQEETVTHILGEYAIGASDGYDWTTYRDRAHPAGEAHQDDYRRGQGRSEITGSVAKPYGGPRKWLWGAGVEYEFDFANGTGFEFHIWPGGLWDGAGTTLPPRPNR
jgi:hypothetical protein